MECPSCHEYNDDDAMFCVYCGFDISERETVLTIGRDHGNTIVQNYPIVSGSHCRIYISGKSLFIQDLNSANGTFVNGERIPPSKKKKLNINDDISLGSHKLSPHDIFSRINGPGKAVVRPGQKPKGTDIACMTIGSGPENDIILDYPQISWEHARLVRGDGVWALEDRKSTNGTYVNDRSRRITRCEITSDDTIYFGSFKISARRLLKAKKETAFGRSDPHAIAITKAETIFGRDPASTIHLDFSQISWRHAKLTHTMDGKFHLEDLGSTNGTFVNGRKIKATYVTPKDTISFGSFVFRLTEDNKIIKRDYRGDIRIDADEITYQVYDKKKRKNKILLDGVSFSIFPSEFVGLMGPSGAGKTTLLLAMNGYIPPSHGGSMINELSLYENYNAFRGLIGYVPQEDIIHPELTVYEALYYTAKLRLPSDTPKQKISEKINRILSQLELLDPTREIDVRDVIIGSAEKKGISGGQRKRVNLAMELLTDPSLLFLDEPTSGLASEDTLTVMKVLRGLADDGKTIILTIHQPSLEAYKNMDNVIILSSGKLMYYGPTYPDSLTFFNQGLPSEQVLDSPDNVLRGLKKRSEKEWEGRYKTSNYYKEYVQERKHKECPVKKGVQKPSRPVNLRQWWTLTCRYLAVKKKDSLNTVILLLQAPVIAALIALVFHEKDFQPYVDTPLFLLIISALWFGTSNSAREIVAENAIYRRERMVNLKIASYVFSKCTVLSMLCFLQCIIMVGIVHVALGWGDFYKIFGVTFLTSIAGLGIGLLVSSLTRTQQAAVAIVPLVLLPMVILGGGMLPVNKMNETSKYLSYFVPSRWAYESVIHIKYDKAKEEEEDETSEKTHFVEKNKPDHIETLFGKNKRENWELLAIIATFIAGTVSATMISLRFRDKV